MKTSFFSIAVLFVVTTKVAAANFGEGYSSSEPLIPAKIYHRAFTIYTSQEICNSTPTISDLNVYLEKVVMKVGDRIHLNSADDSTSTELVIEAFDKKGNFVPSIPIIVSYIPKGATATYDPGTIITYSSWYYLEAKKPGKFDIVAWWACASIKNKPPVKKSITVQVIESNE